MIRSSLPWAALVPACISVALATSCVPTLAQIPSLGPGASLNGARPFPPDNPWNQDISALHVDPNSAAILATIGLSTGLHPDFGTVWNGEPNGIPYIVVAGTQPLVPITFDYADESDPGPYPIPRNAPIEGGPAATGDRHVLVIDRDHGRLFETWASYPNANFTAWTAGSGAVFDLNSDAVRPIFWTSADAAGLPIFPGLVRDDEVLDQEAILHALRFTVQHTRRAFIAPARHFASTLTDPKYPPMGMRVRLKASFDISSFPPSVQVILKALKRYGMFVADNGSNWFISGAPSMRWSDDDLHTLTEVHGSDLEVVQMGDVITDVVGTPTGLNATAASGKVTLAWQAASKATAYNVKRATVSGGPYTTIVPNTTQTSAADAGVTNGVTYYYVVSGVCVTGQSVNSSEVKVTPQATRVGVAFTPSPVVGGVPTVCTVTLSNPAGSGNVTAKLTASNRIVTLPATVTILAGATSVHFTTTTVGVAADTPVTVAVSALSVSGTATLTVQAAHLVSVTLVDASGKTVTSVTGGTGVHLALMLDGLAPPAGATVKLTSTSTSLLSPPKSVTIASGAGSNNTSLTTGKVAAGTSKTVQVAATYGGKSLTASLTIHN